MKNKGIILLDELDPMSREMHLAIDAAFKGKTMETPTDKPEEKTTIEVKYERGHTYTEIWVKTDYFCPHCSIKEVFVEDSDGDYYVGPTFFCVSCMGSFHLPYNPTDNWQDLQRQEQLRSQDATKSEANS